MNFIHEIIAKTIMDNTKKLTLIILITFVFISIIYAKFKINLYNHYFLSELISAIYAVIIYDILFESFIFSKHKVKIQNYLNDKIIILSEQLATSQKDYEYQIINLKEINDNLQYIITDMESDVENIKSNYLEKIDQLKKNENHLLEQIHKIELLENAYAKRFGAAKVKIVKETIDIPKTCLKCYGTGCGSCGDKGWIDVPKEEEFEVVEFYW